MRVPHVSLCKVPRHALRSVSIHPLHSLGRFLFFDPVFDYGGSRDRRVDLADKGGAVEDEEAIFDGLDHDPLSRQGFADPPATALDIDGSLAVDLERPCVLRILPWWRMGVVAPSAWAPHAGRSPHLQGFMGPHLVVLRAVCVQPRLRLS